MVSHSVEAYLKRLSPEKMECLLKECLQEEGRLRYSFMLPDILKVALERNNNAELLLSPELQEFLLNQLHGEQQEKYPHRGVGGGVQHLVHPNGYDIERGGWIYETIGKL